MGFITLDASARTSEHILGRTLDHSPFHTLANSSGIFQPHMTLPTTYLSVWDSRLLRHAINVSTGWDAAPSTLLPLLSRMFTLKRVYSSSYQYSKLKHDFSGLTDMLRKWCGLQAVDLSRTLVSCSSSLQHRQCQGGEAD